MVFAVLKGTEPVKGTAAGSTGVVLCWEEVKRRRNYWNQNFAGKRSRRRRRRTAAPDWRREELWWWKPPPVPSNTALHLLLSPGSHELSVAAPVGHRCYCSSSFQNDATCWRGGEVERGGKGGLCPAKFFFLTCFSGRPANIKTFIPLFFLFFIFFCCF